MTDKEVIIDGVNVAGCEFLLPTGYCKIQTVFQQNGEEKPYGNFLECHLCKECYYKELKRLQAKNEKLKAERNKYKKQHRKNRLDRKKYQQALEDILQIICDFGNHDILTFPDFKPKDNYKLIMTQFNKPLKEILQKCKILLNNQRNINEKLKKEIQWK